MDYRKVKAIEQANKQRWLNVTPHIKDLSGIYILTRIDETGIKYAYVGQAKKVLTRLANHLSGYEQHIDRSLKAYGLYNKITNPYGWNIDQLIYIPIEDLDALEKLKINEYAKNGYQMRNVTGGGQGKGKVDINERKQPKTYREGVKRGEFNAMKKIKEMFDANQTTLEIKIDNYTVLLYAKNYLGYQNLCVIDTLKNEVLKEKAMSSETLDELLTEVTQPYQYIGEEMLSYNKDMTKMEIRNYKFDDFAFLKTNVICKRVVKKTQNF